jgi:hypothetical protein
METSLSDFISAGFIITREVDRPSYMSADLLPPHIVSASGCIARFVPETWCIEWTQDNRDRRIEQAGAFGLDSAALAEITAWVTARFDDSILWPNVMVDLETARELVSQFLRALPDVKVLELALHRSMTESFCHEAEPSPQEPGYAPIGRQGVHEAILKGKPASGGGQVLGFEPLVFNYTLSCSWLCNGLETAIDREFGIRPNPHGLITGFDEAYKCVEYISRPDVGAEPGLWLPWLLVDHTERPTVGGPGRPSSQPTST